MSAPAIPPEVLDAARRLIDREGVEALTMERLARATRLSRATLYRQTGGREAVLDAVAAAGGDVGDRTDTRERILRGAREVFGRAGFDGAAVEDIAIAADVGVATIYRTFGDKDGLVAAFLDQLAPRKAARALRDSATGDLAADLERLAERMLVGARDDAPLIRLLILETLRGGPLLPRVRARSPLRTQAVLAQLFREHLTRGEVRDFDPDQLAQAFGGMVLAFGVVAPILGGAPEGDPRRTAKAITSLFLHGALSRKAKP